MPEFYFMRPAFVAVTAASQTEAAQCLHEVSWVPSDGLPWGEHAFVRLYPEGSVPDRRTAPEGQAERDRRLIVEWLTQMAPVDRAEVLEHVREAFY